MIIQKYIRFDEPLTEEQKARLAKVAAMFVMWRRRIFSLKISARR